MSNTDLRQKGHKFRGERMWWYELPKGIEILASYELPPKTRCVRISWEDVRAALARKDKMKGGD
jgi:hypothetical protein